MLWFVGFAGVEKRCNKVVTLQKQVKTYICKMLIYFDAAALN